MIQIQNYGLTFSLRKSRILYINLQNNRLNEKQFWWKESAKSVQKIWTKTEFKNNSLLKLPENIFKPLLLNTKNEIDFLIIVLNAIVVWSGYSSIMLITFLCTNFQNQNINDLGEYEFDNDNCYESQNVNERIKNLDSKILNLESKIETKLKL